MRKASAVTKVPQQDIPFDPNNLLHEVKRTPSIYFEWKKIGEKRRLIGAPNSAMSHLHHLYREHLREVIIAMGRDGDTLIKLPSATGCVSESNPLKNAEKHAHGEFFYITDFSHAYPSVDLERLSLLLVFIEKYAYYRADYTLGMFARNELAHFALRADPLYSRMLSFVKMAFGGLRGVGLAVGGNLSPYLLNVYCEVFLDSRLRKLFQKQEDKRAPKRAIPYTRYVDDLVFSRGIPVMFLIRQEIRRYIEEAGFGVNHKKSKVLARSMGTVFVTKQGMREDGTNIDGKQKPSILVFPQKKRRRNHGIIGSYLAEPFQNDQPEVIRGIIAEFLHYLSRVETPTATDKKTFTLCKQFEEVSDKYRKHYKGERAKA